MTQVSTHYTKQIDGRFACYKNYYSSCSRVEKIKDAWTNALNTRGKAIFDPKWWNMIKEAILGRAVSRTKYKSCLKIHTLNPVMHEKSANVSVLQDEITKRKIDLNLNPPRIEKSNLLNPETKREFLDSLNKGMQENIANLLLDSMEFISFEKLLNGLNACTSKLSEKLNGFDYQVGFAPKKSQKWVAELAIPMLNKAPSGSFTPTIDTIGASSAQGTLSKEKHLVVFDDCAYSGAQLKGLITNLRREAHKTFGKAKVSIHIVVPFISRVAIERLNFHKNSEYKGETCKVHIYTTSTPIPTVKERLSEQQYSKYESADSRELNPGCDEFIANKCLAYTEWKVPDTTSIPLIFSQTKIKLFGDSAPPYKRDY